MSNPIGASLFEESRAWIIKSHAGSVIANPDSTTVLHQIIHCGHFVIPLVLPTKLNDNIRIWITFTAW
jgi:hypothetical protein